MMVELALRVPVRLFAPAKVNLGLEVTGRRDDGFHEVVTVLDAISLFDIIDLLPGDDLSVRIDTGFADEQDLVERALRNAEDAFGVEFRMTVNVSKAIPVAAGLGGGSSDSGTVLNALGRLFELEHGTLVRIASSLGSDVPFFFESGTALATGTGTDLVPLRSASRRWYVVVVPDLSIPGKTKRMYRALRESDFTDGSRTRSVARRMCAGASLSGLSLRNAFERPLREYEAVRQTIAVLESAGASVVVPSGAGPAVFAVFDTYQHARSVWRTIGAGTGQVFLATNVGADINALRLAHWM